MFFCFGSSKVSGLQISEELVFDTARRIGDKAVRADYVEQVCLSNRAIKARVLELLALHDEEVSLFDRPASGLPQTLVANQVSESAGTQVGPYKLLQKIGEGGMGVVYMAEQSKPVERRVALKIIKPGMDTNQVIARFEAERQALAMMDHPNIAKVLDAGETDNGRPYFVMELVKGVPITEYCDEHHLTPKERLELFLAVLHAVQHAHQKGIIHRDLKPSNVLVAEYDHQAVPKVIDFGVAKATNQRLTDKTMFTQYGQLVGTFEYMSPEQAKLNQMDIDTRSDIYSLGVLLYELLTGDTPFDRLRLRSAAFDELLRIIREEEPPIPSTRLSTSASLPALSANRSTDSKKLSTLMRGELDWIVMKAIEKERSRRYETPNAFADDIQRYLNQEAIVARPASTAYRLKKFTQRNFAAVASGFAIAAALLLGTFASTWMAIREYNANTLAQKMAAEADAQFKNAVSAKVDAENERTAAEKLSLELIGKNEELKEQKDAQRRTAYIGQMNLIQKAWDANQFDRVRDLLNATRPGPGESDERGLEWYFWQRRIHPEEDAVKVATRIKASTFSPDARLFAYVDYDHMPTWKIVVMETTTGKVVFEKEMERHPMSSAELVHVDDSRVAVAMTPKQASRGGTTGTATLSVFRMDNMELAMSIQAKSYHEYDDSFFFSRDGQRVAAAMEEPIVQVWDTSSGESVAQVPVPTSSTSPLESLFVTLNHDGTKVAIKPVAKIGSNAPMIGISIVELSTGATVLTPPVVGTDGFGSSDLYFTPNGKHVLSSDRRTVSTFDAISGNKLRTFEHVGEFSSNSISPDGRWFALEVRQTAWMAGEKTAQPWIEIVDATTGEVVDVITGYAGFTGSYAFSADSSRLLSDHPQGKGVVTWPLQCAFSSDSENETAPSWAWRVMSSEEGGRWQTQVNDSSGLPMTATTDPSQFASEVTLIDNTGANEARKLPIADHRAMKIFSPDGQYLVTICADQRAELLNAGELKIWETKTGKNILITRLGAHSFVSGSEFKFPWIAYRKHIAFSPDSRQIAVAFPNVLESGQQGPMKIRIWDLVSGAELTPRDSTLNVDFKNRIAFSTNGEKLLVLPELPVNSRRDVKQTTTAFDTKTGKILWEHDIVCYGSICTANNTLVVSIVDEDGETSAVGWEPETGMEVFRSPWFADNNLSFVAIDDRRTRVALVSDGKTQIIDAKSGKKSLVLEGTGEEVLDVTFSAEGHRIVTCLGSAITELAQVRSAITRSALSQRPRGFAIWDGRSGQELLTVRLPAAVKTWSTQSASIEQNQNLIRIGGRFHWSTAPLSAETEANELLGAARSLLLASNSNLASQERAVHFLNEALRLDPHIRDARSLMALGQLQMGRLVEALSSVGVNGTESKTTASSTAEELTLRALAMHQRGQQAEAKQLLEKAQRTVSDSETVWQLLVQQAKQQLEIPPAEQNPQAWIGHKFVPRTFTSIPMPYLISKVKGDRLWVGNESIASSEVVSLGYSIEYYASLIATNPKSAVWWNYRGAAYELLGEYDKAIDDYTKAIELYPDAAYLVNRGNLYVREKKSYALAMADFEQAIAIQPTYTWAHASMICTLRRIGKPEQALEKANEAIRVEPTYGTSRNGINHCERAYVQAALGNLESMRADFEEAIRLSPDDRNMWLAKAWLLSTSTDDSHRDGKQAIEAATKACELTFWKDEDALGHLAAAYAESGDFAKAVEWQTKAIEYAPPAKRPKLELRRNLYSDGKPYRESLMD